MTSWPKVPLGKMADITAGDSAPQTADAYSPDGRPFVRMQDLGRHGRTDNLIETTDRVSESASARLKLFRKGSILVPKSGASIRLNHRAILGIDAHVVSHLAVVTPGPSINGRLLYYWLSNMDMGKVAPESDYPSLRLSDLAQVMIPLPTPSEQDRIVQILDEAEALRHLRAHADKRNGQVINALFVEMFGDPMMNEKAWRLRPLGDLTLHLTSGSRGWSQLTGKGTDLFLRTQDINDGSIAENLLAVDAPGGAEAERTRLVPGDVVVTITGVVGKAAVFRGSERPVYVSQHVAMVRPDSDQLSAEYLVAYVNLLVGGVPILALSQYGQTKPGLGFRELKTALIPLPPLELQRLFTSRVVEVRELQGAQTASRQRLDNLFQSLLQSAFQGRL